MTAITALAPSFHIFAVIQVCIRQNCPQSIGLFVVEITLADICTAFLLEVHGKWLSIAMWNKLTLISCNSRKWQKKRNIEYSQEYSSGLHSNLGLKNNLNT